MLKIILNSLWYSITILQILNKIDIFVFKLSNFFNLGFVDLKNSLSFSFD